MKYTAQMLHQMGLAFVLPLPASMKCKMLAGGMSAGDTNDCRRKIGSHGGGLWRWMFSVMFQPSPALVSMR